MNLYNSDSAVPLGYLEHKAAVGEERASEGAYISISVWISRALLKQISQFSALLCFGLPQGSSPRTCNIFLVFIGVGMVSMCSGQTTTLMVFQMNPPINTRSMRLLSAICLLHRSLWLTAS